MNYQNFDRLTRAVSTRLPRRSLAGLLGVSAAGLGALGLADLTEAKKKKNKKRKRKKKVKRNDFNCVDVGNFCKNNSQCCSGICQGKKNKKKCQAHDQSTCQVGQDTCQGPVVTCTMTSGFTGECATTTGKAPYCLGDGECRSCSKDSDCVPFFGAGAACIVCTTCPEGTACVGLNEPE